METVREIVAWFVVVIGFVGWTSSLPAIRLLCKVKRAESFSLLSMWAGFVMTIIIFAHILLQIRIDWALAITYFIGLICCTVFLVLVHYYKRWPGGRNHGQPLKSG